MKDALKIIGIGVLIGIGLFLIEIGFRFLSGSFDYTDGKLWEGLGFYILYSVPLSFVNSYFFDWINYQVEWGLYSKYRLSAGIFGSVILTLGTIFLIRIVNRVGIDGLTYKEFIAKENPTFYLIALIITLVISLIFHAAYFYKELQKSKLLEQKVIAGTASAKFESLKNQIDPHFLFNSLNVLTSLIEENPEIAQKFTSSLSRVYRYVLEQKDKELVPIEEELEFAATYINLLKIRFESGLVYDAPEGAIHPDAKIIPLALQLLLENSIKHNVVSENKPLHIRIYEKDNMLIVENNFQKKEVLQERKGMGIQNIIDRYRILTKRLVVIEDSTEYFRVKLPILTKKTEIMKSHEYNQDITYFKAKERVKEIKEFYGNLASYCIVIPFLIFINYTTYWEFQWFWFPLLGWGLGLTIHGLQVFGYGRDWEERKIKELMKKEKAQENIWE